MGSTAAHARCDRAPQPRLVDVTAKPPPCALCRCAGRSRAQAINERQRALSSQLAKLLGVTDSRSLSLIILCGLNKKHVRHKPKRQPPRGLRAGIPRHPSTTTPSQKNRAAKPCSCTRRRLLTRLPPTALSSLALQTLTDRINQIKESAHAMRACDYGPTRASGSTSASPRSTSRKKSPRSSRRRTRSC